VRPKVPSAWTVLTEATTPPGRSTRASAQKPSGVAQRARARTSSLGTGSARESWMEAPNLPANRRRVLAFSVSGFSQSTAAPPRHTAAEGSSMRICLGGGRSGVASPPSTPSTWAWAKEAVRKSTSVSVAPVRSARVKEVPTTLAPVRSAPVRSAESKRAPDRSAPTKRALRKRA